MKIAPIHALIIALVATAPAWAMSTPDPEPKEPKDPKLEQARSAMDLVFRHYNEALRLDPKHRGAHEYLGEAYLLSGNLPKAKEHLARLDKLCTFGCEEYSKLKKEIAAYEQRNAKK